MFKEVPSEFDFPSAEREVREFWEREHIYEKSLEQRRGAKPFVFYEGPPTANGLPHPGHCLTRAIKDVFPRYRTMCGYYCERKAGWDTHGLPVEVEVCKELGIHGKDEIEKYGIEKFNRKCLESVFRYTKEWETLTRRLGFWVNLDEAYVTYHQSYVESVWWSLKTLFDRGLLYQGHKVVWWWAQGGTALSSGEVGQGYREVDDPSVFVRFSIVMDERAKQRGIAEKTSLLVWTTTPWTLISNTFAAVNKDIEYAIVSDEKAGERLVVAAALVEAIAKKAKREWTVERTLKGSELVGLRYTPPFRESYYDRPSPDGVSYGELKAPVQESNAIREQFGWTVEAAPFVTLDSGTGLVHEAPAFGEVDYALWQQRVWDTFAPPHNDTLFCAVGPDGKFTDEAPAAYRGRWVKEADKDIIRDLKDRGLLLHQEQYRHEYPFCWRADQDPLIQYPRKSWFVKTTKFVDAMLANNRAINWLPEHIKEGRFGKFLESNVDWALSRERFWGTPLPIWVCEKTGKMEAIGSFAELKAKPGASDGGLWAKKKAEDAALSDHLRVHKPYIDAWMYDSPHAAGAKMRRVPEVIDCWYDAGCMPFAQWGFPHAKGSVEKFSATLPADFISEAIDQTRGWFYALLAISTLLFGENGEMGGTGVPPVSPSGIGADLSVRRRNLPHWEQGGSTYFVTFRVKGGELSPAERSIVLNAARHFDSSRYLLHAAVVMPDHVHLLLTPNEKSPGSWWTLSELLHSIKSFSAKAINNARNASGALWLDEYFDRIIRSFDDFNEKQDYILNNPLKNGLGETYQWVWLEPLEEKAHGRDARATHVRRPPPHPFRNCIVLGLIQGEDGQKLSKSKRNYKEPSYIFDKEGADAMRWLFFSGAAPWTSTRFQERAIAESQRDFLIRLYNVYSFFVIYANIDKWSPGNGQASLAHGTQSLALTELDRWVRSELHRTTREVRRRMDAYDNFGAARTLIDFVDLLSNWYVRRSRDRFWAAGMMPDKQAAYATLYDCLMTTAKLIAPFVPFVADAMYQNLARSGGGDAPISVHLCDYPAADEAVIDEKLSAESAIVREIVSLGRAARAEAKLRVRQPLRQVEIVVADREHLGWLESHKDLIADELNVKNVAFIADADQYVEYRIAPNFKSIGPKFGKLGPRIKELLGASRDPAAMRRELDSSGKLSLTVDGQAVELTPEDVQIGLIAKPGWAAAQGRSAVVVLSVELDDALRDEGLAREIVHHVQQMRKKMQLRYEQRIELAVGGDDAIGRVIGRFGPYISQETLATKLSPVEPGGAGEAVDIEGHAASLAIRPL